VASEKGHWKPGLWTGRNGLHEERPGIVEDIEDSGLKLGCDNAKEWGRLVEVMAECADRTVEGVRAVGEGKHTAPLSTPSPWQLADPAWMAF
jgi:hypothetical protein